MRLKKERERERDEKATAEVISGLRERQRKRGVTKKKRSKRVKLKDRGADGWERRGVKTAASSTSLLHSSNLSLRQQAGGKVDRTPKQVCYQQQPLADVRANVSVQKVSHQGCTIYLKCTVIASCDYSPHEYRRERLEIQ